MAIKKRSMPTKMILALMFWMLVVPAFAQDETSPVTEHLSSVRARAEQEDAEAQYFLGILYYNGAGVPQDYTEARRWLQMAAEQGYAEAQFLLGVLYYNGAGVPEDYTEARCWYQMAAEQGHAKAQYNLGGLYYNGAGVPQDYTEAGRWLQMAAEQGYAEAQYFLGGLYDLGLGVPEDYVLAHMWYNLAASVPSGEDRTEQAAEARAKVANKMPPEDISEAQRLAREWKPKGSGSQ
jgi:TPR repeat protein